MPNAGEIWPKPYQQVESNKYYAVNGSNFQFIVSIYEIYFLLKPKNCNLLYICTYMVFLLKAVNKNCALLQSAFTRYANIITAATKGYIRAPATATLGIIQQFRINLTQPCEDLPHLDMDESCECTSA